MSKRDTKRKAKVKANKMQAVLIQQDREKKVADAIEDICSPIFPEYVDNEEDGYDLIGRATVWQMGQIAWNTALEGRSEVPPPRIEKMNVGQEIQEIVAADINKMIRLKYEKYPNMRISIEKTEAVMLHGLPKLKITLGAVCRPVEIPDYSLTSDENKLKQTNVSVSPDKMKKETKYTPEQLLARRKELGLSQVKLGEILGVSAKKISAWEHGQSEPDETAIRKLFEIKPGNEK